MQKLLLSLFLVSSLIFAGCSRGKDTTPSLGDDTVTNDPEIIQTMDFRQTGIELCDKYLAVLRCVAMKASGDIATSYMQSHASLLQAWVTMPESQVSQTCTVMADALQNNTAELEKYDCKL